MYVHGHVCTLFSWMVRVQLLVMERQGGILKEHPNQHIDRSFASIDRSFCIIQYVRFIRGSNMGPIPYRPNQMYSLKKVLRRGQELRFITLGTTTERHGYVIGYRTPDTSRTTITITSSHDTRFSTMHQIAHGGTSMESHSSPRLHQTPRVPNQYVRIDYFIFYLEIFKPRPDRSQSSQDTVTYRWSQKKTLRKKQPLDKMVFLHGDWLTMTSSIEALRQADPWETTYHVPCIYGECLQYAFLFLLMYFG